MIKSKKETENTRFRSSSSGIMRASMNAKKRLRIRGGTQLDEMRNQTQEPPLNGTLKGEEIENRRNLSQWTDGRDNTV